MVVKSILSSSINVVRRVFFVLVTRLIYDSISASILQNFGLSIICIMTDGLMAAIMTWLSFSETLILQDNISPMFSSDSIA